MQVDLRGAVRPVPTDVEVALLRVAQEALTNVRRHSGTTRAWVRLEFLPGRVRLDIRDAGCGFDVTVPTPGYGLVGMRERVSRAGGRLSIHSRTGQCARIRAELDA